MWKLGQIRLNAKNADKMLIALNLIDLFQCTVVLPYQAFLGIKLLFNKQLSVLLLHWFWFLVFILHGGADRIEPIYQDLQTIALSHYHER